MTPSPTQRGRAGEGVLVRDGPPPQPSPASREREQIRDVAMFPANRRRLYTASHDRRRTPWI